MGRSHRSPGAGQEQRPTSSQHEEARDEAVRAGLAGAGLTSGPVPALPGPTLAAGGPQVEDVMRGCGCLIVALFALFLLLVIAGSLLNAAPS